MSFIPLIFNAVSDAVFKFISKRNLNKQDEKQLCGQNACENILKAIMTER